MRNLMISSAALAVLLVSQGEAQAAETIVGTWAQAPADCKAAPVTISPLALNGGDVFCTFNSVKRDGDRATWKGHCFADGGTRRPETGEDGEVSAFHRDGKLQIEGLGFAFPDLQRCQ